MSFERIAGMLFSGFAVKAFAIGFALWIASEVTSKAFAFVESFHAAF